MCYGLTITEAATESVETTVFYLLSRLSRGACLILAIISVKNAHVVLFVLHINVTVHKLLLFLSIKVFI